MIQNYKSNSKREEEEKNHFYEELQQTIDGCNRNGSDGQLQWEGGRRE